MIKLWVDFDGRDDIIKICNVDLVETEPDDLCPFQGRDFCSRRILIKIKGVWRSESDSLPFSPCLTVGVEEFFPGVNVAGVSSKRSRDGPA